MTKNVEIAVTLSYHLAHLHRFQADPSNPFPLPHQQLCTKNKIKLYTKMSSVYCVKLKTISYQKHAILFPPVQQEKYSKLAAVKRIIAFKTGLEKGIRTIGPLRKIQRGGYCVGSEGWIDLDFIAECPQTAENLKWNRYVQYEWILSEVRAISNARPLKNHKSAVKPSRTNAAHACNCQRLLLRKSLGCNQARHICFQSYIYCCI